MSAAEFVTVGDGKYRVAGELGFETVPAIWAQSVVGLDDSADPQIDLGQLTKVDSAALALVIEWIRWGAERRKRLRFVNVPDKLMALARLSEVSHLLDGTSARD